MHRVLIGTLVSLSMVVGWAGSAGAVEFCLETEEFLNIWRLEATPVGSFAALNGNERVFGERAVVGTAYVQPGGTNARLGFTTYLDSGSGQLVIDAGISLLTGSGPYRAVNPTGTVFTGTINIVACPPILVVSAERVGPDIAQ